MKTLSHEALRDTCRMEQCCVRYTQKLSSKLKQLLEPECFPQSRCVTNENSC